MSDPRNTGQCGIVLLEEPEEKFRFRYKSGKDDIFTAILKKVYNIPQLLF
jgi:hypothetical protein